MSEASEAGVSVWESVLSCWQPLNMERAMTPAKSRESHFFIDYTAIDFSNRQSAIVYSNGNGKENQYSPRIMLFQIVKLL